MSSVVLSAMELRNSNVNGEDDRNTALTDTSTQINDETKTIHTKSMQTILENKKDLEYRKRSPTTNSSDSNNISIVTTDESENDSSVIDPNSDIDDVINYNNGNEVTSPTEIVLVQNPTNFCQQSVLCTNNDTKPNIGSIALQNSSDITFGNKTFYQAPVTINYYTYDKNKSTDVEPSENDNVGNKNNSIDNQSQKEKVKSPKILYSILKKWKCTKKRTLVSAISAGACLFLVIVLLVIFIPGDEISSDSDVPVPSGPLKIVSRNDWNARPPLHELDKLQPPVARVIIAHTATVNCTTQEQCSGLVRNIQTFHIEENGWDDIGLNFLVGGDGAVYVGIGWDFEGAHTYHYNKNSICIAFIGNFQKITPPKRQLYAAEKLIEEGVKMKKLIPDYRLYGHRQLINTESPGLILYEIIKKWDHWTEAIE